MSVIAENQTVMFYPSYGRLVDGGQRWRISVVGTVYNPREAKLRDRVTIRLMQKIMKVSPQELESEIFQQRIARFISHTQRRRRIAINVGSKTYLLKKRSKRHGLFRGSFHLNLDEVENLKQDGHLSNGWLHFTAANMASEKSSFTGRAQLICPSGLSIVSDIDDTIKHTEVTSRRAMLVNTFLKKFEPISGMAEVFRDWADQGAAFHFVSSSPWQLYHSLADLCRREGFPEASFHLRPFRLRDQMIRNMLLLRRQGKLRVIRSIIKAFPQRSFVLLGDSAERDPEIYGAIARKFPHQIISILIRELPQRSMSHQRCERAFRQLSPQIWQRFEHSQQLAQLLPMEETVTR